MPRTYNTRQKDEITAIIARQEGRHFTAEDICEALKEDGGHVGLSTVYRHLERLVNDGELRKYVSSAGESACYQAALGCREHFHLKCIVCGKLEHLSCTFLDDIGHHLAEEHGFAMDPSRTVFYGICKECGKK